MLLLFVQNWCRIPRRMRGLKVHGIRLWTTNTTCRIPRRMRGLKASETAKVHRPRCRIPRGMRGLKDNGKQYCIAGQRSHPSRDAWIVANVRMRSKHHFAGGFALQKQGMYCLSQNQMCKIIISCWKIIIDIKQVVPINAIIVCTKLLSHPAGDAWIKGLINGMQFWEVSCRILQGMRGLKA